MRIRRALDRRVRLASEHQHELARYRQLAAVAFHSIGRVMHGAADGRFLQGQPMLNTNRSSVFERAVASLVSDVTMGRDAIVASRMNVTMAVTPYAIVGDVPAGGLGFGCDSDGLARRRVTRWWNRSAHGRGELASPSSRPVIGQIQEHRALADGSTKRQLQ